MKKNKLSVPKVKTIAGVACITIGLVLWNAGDACNAQTQTNAQTSPPGDAQPPPVDLPTGVQDVLKLVRNGLKEDVILAKIKNDGSSYNLTADQIIYLSNSGVSQNVISALLQTKSANPVPPNAPPASGALAPAPPAPTPGPVGPIPRAVTTTAPPAPPPAEPQVSLESFHAQLAPYGTWVEVPGYGQCWHPVKVIAATPGGDWRPYYDNGHWDYTENGWFWVSDYNWGDIPFHYGRWIREPGYGWLWVPDLTWGPAWVCWRHAETDGYIGWAPLPFGAVWVDGGWRFHGRAVVEVGFDFGLGEDFFVFVGHDHFHEHYFRYRSRRDYAFHVHREVIHGFYGRTVPRNEFRRDEHGRFVNEGLGRKRVEEVTHHKVEVARFEERHPAVRPVNQTPPRGGTTAATPRGGKLATPAPGAAPATSTHGAAPATQPEPNKVFRPPTMPPKPTTTSKPATTQKK